MMMEKEIIIDGGNTIYGTIAMPKENGKFPAILLIGGSGPLDRDGNDREGKYPTNLYKDLAHFMTKLGFATLRYDKRGTGKRDGDWLAAGLSDLVEDARRAVEYLQSHPNIDSNKIIVCGHSEGTIIGTKLAGMFNLAGLMFLAGGVDNLIEATNKQRLSSYKELFETPGIMGWLYRTLKVDVKGEKAVEKQMQMFINSDKDIVKVQLFFRQPAKWYREHHAYNTREALKNVTCPVFAIVGDKDINADSEVLKELSGLVKGKSEYYIIPNMEHGFKIQPEPKSILNFKKMFKELLKRPIHEDALKTIETWLVNNFKIEEVSNGKREVV
jgi:uncharacterized protein